MWMLDLSRLSEERGSGIIGMIGVLAVVSIVATTLVPNGISKVKSASDSAEMNHLKAIGEGVKSYMRSKRAWPPTLASLSPAYVHFAGTQLTQNEHGYLRYYVVHPTTSGFTNAAGIVAVDLVDVQFLLITNLTRDEVPGITNATEFDAWWDSDASATPGLFIYRGTLTEMFYRFRVHAGVSGGSHQIDGVTINSGGGILAPHDRYHLRGTSIRLDDQDPYGTPEITVSLVASEAYTFCTPVWQRSVNPTCQAFTVRDEFVAKGYNGNDGLRTWSNDWQEFGESDGPRRGKIKVDKGGGGHAKCAGAVAHCLKIDGNKNFSQQVSREADLSGATSATLTFSYRRDANTADDPKTVTLEASGNGGAAWTTLQAYLIDADDSSHIPQSFDLTPYIASNTQIRFSTSSIQVNDKMYIDDVQIEWN